MFTYYELLEIRQSANRTEIESAYKKTSLIWHPDRAKCWVPVEHTKIAEDIDKRLNNAHDTLQDQEKRNEYDQTLWFIAKGFKSLTSQELQEERRLRQGWNTLKNIYERLKSTSPQTKNEKILQKQNAQLTDWCQQQDKQIRDLSKELERVKSLLLQRDHEQTTLTNELAKIKKELMQSNQENLTLKSEQAKKNQLIIKMLDNAYEIVTDCDTKRTKYENGADSSVANDVQMQEPFPKNKICAPGLTCIYKIMDVLLPSDNKPQFCGIKLAFENRQQAENFKKSYYQYFERHDRFPSFDFHFGWHIDKPEEINGENILRLAIRMNSNLYMLENITPDKPRGQLMMEALMEEVDVHGIPQKLHDPWHDKKLSDPDKINAKEILALHIMMNNRNESTGIELSFRDESQANSFRQKCIKFFEDKKYIPFLVQNCGFYNYWNKDKHLCLLTLPITKSDFFGKNFDYGQYLMKQFVKFVDIDGIQIVYQDEERQPLDINRQNECAKRFSF